MKERSKIEGQATVAEGRGVYECPPGDHGAKVKDSVGNLTTGVESRGFKFEGGGGLSWVVISRGRWEQVRRFPVCGVKILVYSENLWHLRTFIWRFDESKSLC